MFDIFTNVEVPSAPCALRYTVAYDDGDEEHGVPRELVRPRRFPALQRQPFPPKESQPSTARLRYEARLAASAAAPTASGKGGGRGGGAGGGVGALKRRRAPTAAAIRLARARTVEEENMQVACALSLSEQPPMLPTPEADTLATPSLAAPTPAPTSAVVILTAAPMAATAAPPGVVPAVAPAATHAAEAEVERPGNPELYAEERLGDPELYLDGGSGGAAPDGGVRPACSASPAGGSAGPAPADAWGEEEDEPLPAELHWPTP